MSQTFFYELHYLKFKKHNNESNANLIRSEASLIKPLEKARMTSFSTRPRSEHVQSHNALHCPCCSENQALARRWGARLLPLDNLWCWTTWWACGWTDCQSLAWRRLWWEAMTRLNVSWRCHGIRIISHSILQSKDKMKCVTIFTC